MKLGKIDAVDIRSQWKNEEYDFTPWLAKEPHVQILADAIGVDFDVDGIEVRSDRSRLTLSQRMVMAGR